MVSLRHLENVVDHRGLSGRQLVVGSFKPNDVVAIGESFAAKSEVEPTRSQLGREDSLPQIEEIANRIADRPTSAASVGPVRSGRDLLSWQRTKRGPKTQSIRAAVVILVYDKFTTDG